MKKILNICVVMLLAMSLPVIANAIDLTWTAPADNADGTPITDRAGYKIYYGPKSGDYDHNIDVGNVTSKTMPNIEGTTYYSTTAYDTSGNESGFSNEVTATWKNPPDGSQIILSGQSTPIICNGCTLIINGQVQ